MWVQFMLVSCLHITIMACVSIRLQSLNQGDEMSKLKDKGCYVWSGDEFILEKEDKRYQEYQEHKDKHGFSLDELWNLDISIALFVLPRLAKFKEKVHGHPAKITEQEWNRILDKMIWSFTQIVNEEIDDMTEDDAAKLTEGLVLFGKYFLKLWL